MKAAGRGRLKLDKLALSSLLPAGTHPCLLFTKLIFVTNVTNGVYRGYAKRTNYNIPNSKFTSVKHDKKDKYEVCL